MLHEIWQDNNLGQVKVTNVDAKKYKVSDMLTVDKVYTIVNETEEYIFVVDNSGKVGGFYKDYFEKI
ncbi:hypothetical protein GCM10007358_02170 [Phocicoccus schoeneichii]|uniref:Uncharacterized protein n=1 Tax=Phocicoccus schoeneichii TaxID=1812261 RepID=A0A6V7RIT0_9BACL|nr:DUF6501 family protein [Jeotgalicoccus schoeneichii]GGH47360.1 hypothetical protein GCM10007358_02170 [Jeotgalicoccus schoeneichii]CAD2077577.1 hypothetical protein JEOSCH030_01336 [Jeotgalicoccus schoeneichii]